MKFNKDKLIYGLGAIAFFVLFFAWFFLFDSYQLVFKEQTQLFKTGFAFFRSFLDRPGGLCNYAGSFITQFYIDPLSASLTVTLQGVILFLITGAILRFYKITGLLWRLVPVVLLIPFAGAQYYQASTTAALIISTLFFLCYINIGKPLPRYVAGAAGSFLLYFVAGSFAGLLLLLCLIHELVYSRSGGRFIASAVYILMVWISVSISMKYLFDVKGDDIWLALIPLRLKKSIVPFFMLLLAYFPLIIGLAKPLNILFRLGQELKGRVWIKISAGLLLFGLLSFCVVHFTYDIKTEILLQVDYSVQKGDWKKALDYSFSYPGRNQLVLYYGNMAMFKTGQMGDRMFHLPQAGVRGLWLDWKRNEITPFLGGELFYQLGYISEAHRWAFESMEAMGENPRSLKRLVTTSIITGDTSVARHYLNSLDRTLFYRKWAKHYSELLNHPRSVDNDKEIAEKKHLNLTTDIFADSKNNDIGLAQLLADHPDNRMAFEYLMAQKLLVKDIDGFVSLTGRIAELGFKRIPVHYEEAMLLYMNHTGRNIVPEGYSISRETIDRFSAYFRALNNIGSDRKKASQILFRDYGGTYWYYLNFINVAS